MWVSVGEARPVTTGALESKPFHEGELDGFGRVPLCRTYRNPQNCRVPVYKRLGGSPTRVEKAILWSYDTISQLRSDDHLI